MTLATYGERLKGPHMRVRVLRDVAGVDGQHQLHERPLRHVLRPRLPDLPATPRQP
jgi:hypothetical protein